MHTARADTDTRIDGATVPVWDVIRSPPPVRPKAAVLACSAFNAIHSSWFVPTALPYSAAGSGYQLLVLNECVKIVQEKNTLDTLMFEAHGVVMLPASARYQTNCKIRICLRHSLSCCFESRALKLLIFSKQDHSKQSA
jgi:hypothetical protein